MSESAEKPCDSLALLGDYDYDEKEASPEASEPAHMGINEKTDIEVARASSAEADSEQPGSPVSGPDHSSILLDEKKSDDESKVKSIREDEPMETSSAYRGGPCLSEDSSDDDSDDEDDIRKSPVDRKQNQSPKQELEDEATSAVDINSKLESPKTMDETVGMNYEKVKSDSPEESLDCDYGEKPKSPPLDQPTSPKIDKLMECDSAEKPEKPSSSEPVVQEKPIDPENFDGLLVMSGEDSSSPKQLDDNSVDMPKSHERFKSPEQSKKPLEQPNENLLTVMGQLNLTTDDSEKGSPSLSDMPVDVIALIIERSDYKQQLILRKVSKSLRALVDKLKPACESICFMYFRNSINLVFDEQWVMYSKDVFEGPSEDIAVARDDFEKAAFDDLVSTLKNPRLQLEYFHVGYQSGETLYNKVYKGVQSVLESLNHQVSVKEVDLDCANSSGLLSILPHLKPCVLKKISLADKNIEDDWSANSIEMDQIARLEQWKQAEELEFDVFFERFPMEHATHFRRFRLLDELEMDGDKVTRIIEYLTELEHFEHCTLRSYFIHKDGLLHQVLGAPVSSDKNKEIFHHRIANSNYYFEFEKLKNPSTESDYDIEIKKKKQRNN